MVKLFFISYGGGHAKMLIPVIKSLPKDIDYTYLALNTAINDATQEGIRFNTLLDYKNLFSDERIELYGERLLIENHSKGLNISKELSKFSLGLNYLDLVLTHGEEFAEKMYQLKNRQAFLPIHAIRKILKKEMPDLIITTNSPKFEKAAHIVANELNIKSVLMLDLFGYRQNFDPSIKLFFVLCEIAKINTLFYGVESEKIKITVNPAFDTLTNFKQIEKKNKILVAFQNDKNKPAFINIVEKLIIDLKNFQFFLRAHPNDTSGDELILADKYPNAVISNEKLIGKECADSKVMLSIDSTSFLDAISMNCTPISYDLGIINEFIDTKTCLFSDNYEDLKALVLNAVNNYSDDFTNKLKEILYLDGNSTDRVISNIMKNI